MNNIAKETAVAFGMDAEECTEVRKMASSEGPVPTGSCWCDCGGETKADSFFRQGHDTRAATRVIREVYGTTADFLIQHGYDPGAARAAGGA